MFYVWKVAKFNLQFKIVFTYRAQSTLNFEIRWKTRNIDVRLQQIMYQYITLMVNLTNTYNWCFFDIRLVLRYYYHHHRYHYNLNVVHHQNSFLQNSPTLFLWIMLFPNIMRRDAREHHIAFVSAIYISQNQLPCYDGKTCSAHIRLIILCPENVSIDKQPWHVQIYLMVYKVLFKSHVKLIVKTLWISNYSFTVHSKN